MPTGRSSVILLMIGTAHWALIILRFVCLGHYSPVLGLGTAVWAYYPQLARALSLHWKV